MATPITSSDVLFMNVLPNMIEKRLNSWIKSSSSVNIFVTGKTGTGKSSLVNSAVGAVVSTEGHSIQPQTDEVQSYTKEINGIQVNIWDSPGLQDGSNNEQKYLDDIKSKCRGKVDLFLYCIDMSSTRFVPGNSDIIAMQKLSTTLGTDIWKNTLIILTFAERYIMQVEDDYEDDLEGLSQEFEREADSWKGIIHTALQTDVGLDPQLIQNIQVVPTGGQYCPEILPGKGSWLAKLWKAAAESTRPIAQPAFVKINEDRLNDHSISVSIHEDPKILADIGEKLGEELGVPQIGRDIGLSKAQEVLVYLAERNGYFADTRNNPVSVNIDHYKQTMSF